MKTLTCVMHVTDPPEGICLLGVVEENGVLIGDSVNHPVGEGHQ